MTWILALFRSKLARQIGMVLGVVLAILTFGKVQKHKGRVEERQKQKEADYENADAIRKRVDAVKRVPREHKHEYRD